MRGAADALDRPSGEASWTTAISEAEAASRYLRQATAALDRLTRELGALRTRSDSTARLDLAHALTDGPDGGALQALVAAASDDSDPGPRGTARLLLDRLTTALGLEPVAERGELLRLCPADLAEFDVRGTPAATNGDARALYCVTRPGFWLDEHLVARPLLEAVDGEEA